MRIYLPSSLAELRSDRLEPRPAHAVTPDLRAALPDEDDEGLEYAAQLLAADDSLDRLDPARTGARRLVVAADVPPEAVTVRATGADHAPSLVDLDLPVTWDQVACVHVDEDAASEDVEAALTGDDEAVDRLSERDLLWYDASELAALASQAPPGRSEA